MTVVIAAPSGDEALRVTRWIADRTAARLAQSGFAVTFLADERAVRTELESSLGTAVGLVACSHASETRLLCAPNTPMLDGDNVGCIRGRWVHAIGCRSAGTPAFGDPLWQLALDAGPLCWAGYESTVIVEWNPAELSGPITELMELTTCVSLAIADGDRDEPALRRRAQAVADRVLGWCLDNPDHDLWGLEIAAHQLVYVVVRLPSS